MFDFAVFFILKLWYIGQIVDLPRRTHSKSEAEMLKIAQ